MTDVQAMELGRRWLAAGGGWREGMLGQLSDGGPIFRVSELNDNGNALQEYSWWPDLRDPATKGAALEVVRERWGDGCAHIFFADGQWCLRVLPGGAMLEPFSHKRLVDFRAGTEEEVLVLALEAAGGRSDV